MRKIQHKIDGRVETVHAFTVLMSIGWEWYVLEPMEVGRDVYRCLVDGAEQEVGDVSMIELRNNGCMRPVGGKDLHTIMPPIGWDWVP
jgi:hypothetical protein